MANHVFSRHIPASLTTLEWLCFVGGVLIEGGNLTKLALLAIARVLP